MYHDLKSLANDVLDGRTGFLRTNLTNGGILEVYDEADKLIATGDPDVFMSFENLSQEVGFKAGKVAAEIRLSGGDTSKLADTSFDRLVRAIFEMNWLAAQSMKAVQEDKSGPSTGYSNGYGIIEATKTFLKHLTMETLRAAAEE